MAMLKIGTQSTAFLFLALAVLLSGCSTISEKSIPITENIIKGRGALMVSCYENKENMNKVIYTKHQVMMKVFDGKPDRDGTTMLKEYEGANLLMENLAPGRYYLRILGWKDDGVMNTSKSRDFRVEVEEGKTSQVSLVVTDYLKTGVVIGGAVVGTVAIVSVAFAVVFVLALIAAI
jgi:hypothetical protein